MVWKGTTATMQELSDRHVALVLLYFIQVSHMLKVECEILAGHKAAAFLENDTNHRQAGCTLLLHILAVVCLAFCANLFFMPVIQ